MATPHSPLAVIPCLLAGAVAAAEGFPVDQGMVSLLESDRSQTATDADEIEQRRRLWGANQGLRLDLLGGSEHSIVVRNGLGFPEGPASAPAVVEDDGNRRSSGRVGLGLAVAPRDNLQLQLTPFAGYAMTVTPDAAELAPADRERFFEYGLNVHATYNTGTWQFGAGVGYVVTDHGWAFGNATTAAPPTTTTATDRDRDRDQSGPVYSIFIGTKL